MSDPSHEAKQVFAFALAEAQHLCSLILSTPHLFIALIGLRSIKYTPETRRKLNVSCS